MAEQKKIKITQILSIIDQKEPAKRTIRALGLGRPNYAVILTDTPQIRGMVRKIRHMVKVEEVKA